MPDGVRFIVFCLIINSLFTCFKKKKKMKTTIQSLKKWTLAVAATVLLSFQANAQVTLTLSGSGFTPNGSLVLNSSNPYVASCMNTTTVGTLTVTSSVISTYTITGTSWATEGEVLVTQTGTNTIRFASNGYNTGRIYFTVFFGENQCGVNYQRFFLDFNKTFNPNSFLTIVGQNCISSDSKLIAFTINSPFPFISNELYSDKFYWSVPAGFAPNYQSTDGSSQTYSVTSGIVSSATSANFNVTVGGCNATRPLTVNGIIRNAPSPPKIITSGGPSCLPTTVTSFTIQVTNTAPGVNYKFESNNDDWGVIANTFTGFATITNTGVRDAVKSTANIIVSSANSACPTLLSSTIVGYTPRQLTSADKFSVASSTSLLGFVPPGTTISAVGINNINTAANWGITANSNWTIQTLAGTNQVNLIPAANALTAILSVSSVNCSNGVLTQTLAVQPNNPNTISVNGIATGATTCQSRNSVVTLTCNTVNNATGYKWTLPEGWLVRTGSSTASSIFLTITGAAQNGTISVQSTNSTYGFTSTGYTINAAVRPVQPGTISGLPTCVQPNGSFNLLSSAPSTQLFLWTLPAGWITTSPNGNNNIGIQTVGTGSFVVSVQGTNVGCPNSIARTLPVRIYPNVPATIMGTNCVTVGTNTVYTTNTIPGATSYNWSYLTNGGGWSTLTSTTTSVNLSTTGFSANVTLNVIANVTGCGTSNSTSGSKTIGVNPVRPTAIVTPAGLCLGLSPQIISGVYATGSIAAQTLLWTMPAGWTYTTVDVTKIDITTNGIAGTYVVSVQGVTGCGTSAVTTAQFVIQPNVPPTITGTQKVLSSATVNTYVYTTTSIPGASGYNWSLENFGNGWGFAGTNQPSLTTTSRMVTVTVVSAPSQISSNKLSVFGIGCNNSGTGTFTMCFAPVTPATPTAASSATTTPGCYFVGKSMPITYTTDNSSASYVWGVYSISGTPISTWTVTGTTTSSITYDTDGKAGRYVISVQGFNASCGTGNAVILPITVAGVGLSAPNAGIFAIIDTTFEGGAPNGDVLYARNGSSPAPILGYVHQWYKNDVAIINQTSSTLALGVVGSTAGNTFSVDFIKNGCLSRGYYNGTTSYTRNARIAASSVRIASSSNVSITPNPASSSFTVTPISSFIGSYGITITDISGNIVKTLIGTGVSITVSTDGLLSGLYFVKTQTATWTSIDEIVIQK
jgi:hypothetical protein